MIKIRKRGKVTRENSIFHKNGSVSCPISSNKYTEDEYFTIDQDKFHLVEGRSWSVLNDSSHKGGVHYNIRSKLHGKTECLHWVLYRKETLDVGLTTDHILHWTDQRRCSVEFISMHENLRRGAALYHKGRKFRSKVNASTK